MSLTKLTTAPWSESAERVLANLQSDGRSGLANAEAESRLSRFGKNVLSTESKTPAWIKFVAQFKSPVVLALVAATFVSAAMGEWIDAAAICLIVVINAVISFTQESKAEAAAEALKALSAPKAKVIREGTLIEIPSGDVCAGDVLAFEAGDYIAADARILEAHQLSAVEAALTGESLPVEKSERPVAFESSIGDRSNMLFASTAVVTGSGRAVVTATGMESEIGKIAGMLKATTAESTPLQRNIDLVGKRLLWASGGIVVVIALIGLGRDSDWLSVLMSAISLAVAAIPEGLPAVVTVALTLAVRRMAGRNAIIRHLPAVETLGSTDVICTDKTGTLTTGRMVVRDLMPVGRGVMTAEDVRRSGGDALPMLRSALLCNNATYDPSGASTGDPTEVALLQIAGVAELKWTEEQKRYPRVAEWSFDSERKRMSVAVIDGPEIRLHVKGAPESVLPLCKISHERREKVEAALAELSAKGRRVLAVAEKVLGPRALDIASIESQPAGQVESDLEFLGLVAIADPPREEVIPAIRECRDAGIEVVMITGDHPVTARAIATELGIVLPGRFDGVLTGPELSKMGDERLQDVVGKVAVYARVSPEEKLRIVNAWKSKGRIVAMTGDGVNDAPALKTASIGVSMGRGGTEVARQASSMILADDNFTTIVAAVEEGRAVFGNIRRTVEYLLSGNLAEILIMLGAAIAGWPVPLAPIHLLWINLVTDGLPSLALASEPVPKDILKDRSRPSGNFYSDRKFWMRTGAIGGLTGVMCLGVYGYYLKVGDELTARTMAFSFLVYAELFRSFASRSEDKTFFELGPWSNLLHLGAVLLPMVFQLVLHHSDIFQTVFDVRPVTLVECLVIIGLTMIPVTFLELGKLAVRRKKT